MSDETHYAEVTICVDATLELPVGPEGEVGEPTTDEWYAEAREVLTEEVLPHYADIHNPNVNVKETWTE